MELRRGDQQNESGFEGAGGSGAAEESNGKVIGAEHDSMAEVAPGGRAGTRVVAATRPAIAGSSAKAKVSIRGASKLYSSGAKNFAAVTDLNLDIFEGEFLAIVGPTGCGKSTLLNMVAGFERPD